LSAGTFPVIIRLIMTDKMLFDEWPERYDQWFTTPIGQLVWKFEGELIRKLVNPEPGDRLLDAGCGTGVFTLVFLSAGAEVVGLDISFPMLRLAEKKAISHPFQPVQGDMLSLPFRDNYFDKTVSITALEFIEDGPGAVNELLRVTRPGGLVIVATLNSLSPWAARRRDKTLKGQRHILENAFFRSPPELLALTTLQGETATVVHFPKDASPEKALRLERQGQSLKLETGAFAAVKWQKI
jgi:ubiquinone/menaquinone biosynthesis C-methylase UbiE